MSIEITRIFDFPYYQLEKYNLDKALATNYDGNWLSLSTKEYINQANAISRALLRLGIQPNDKIAVISTNNRTEWNVIDIGILQIGAQNVPIYPTISKEDYEYILNHSEAIYCFVSDEEVLEKLNAIKSNTKIKNVYTFDEIGGEKNWKELLELGKDNSNQDEVEARKNTVKPLDLATIIYTSGTTGKPKGVMLSHNNIVSNALESYKRIPIELGNSRALSFLPVCHVYERMLIYLYQYCGTTIYFAPIDKISEYAQEVHPHVMTAVPRLLEKVYDKIIAKGTDLTGIKKKLFFWAVNVGLQYEPYGVNGWWYEQKLKLARKLIFSKWKAALGGEIAVMASGSAPLQPRLARVFNAAGFGVMEGYGLTETSPVVSVNDMRNRGFKIGTVGKPIDRTEVKIAEDGEILIKGPQVMMGYYKDSEKTAEVMTDNYFHTGDIGEIDTEGFLKITDRKKEMFKTSGGKYVAPAVIENQLKQSRFIEQAMVIGEGEKMPAALIQPNFEFIMDWIDRKGKNIEKTPEAIATSKIVIERIQEEVDFCNEKFGKWEKIKRFELTPEIWSIEGGHLTPTMKLKRRVIKEIYKNLYNKIYQQHN
jgi:long-chain acyl-CoA synthetase